LSPDSPVVNGCNTMPVADAAFGVTIMRLGRACLLASALAVLSTVEAGAQFAPPGGQQQQPPCYNDFLPLRQEAEKRAGAVRAASEKKASPQEACQLMGQFADAEAKVVKFVETNGTWCGIPADAVQQMKANHGKTLQIRKRICTAAAAPARPAGPSLSDALGTSAVPTPQTTKRGRGTFDTLTGNALER
jgi:hypothetical protein